MGNFLSNCRPSPRHRPPPGPRPLVSPARDAAPPGRAHPAALAPALRPGRRLFHHKPIPAGFLMAPRKRYPIQQATCYPLGILPVVHWRDPPKKPVLSSQNSRMVGPSRGVRIPPLRRTRTGLPAPPEQAVKAGSIPGSVTPGKEVQGEKPSDVPSRSSPPPVSPSKRPCKRKLAMPLLLPLPPPLLPPLPLPLRLLWGRGELPPPPKLPCIAVAKKPETLEKNTECQQNESLEDPTEVVAECSATQPAPSFSPPASESADPLPLGAHTVQAPAPLTSVADRSAGTQILSVPPPSLTPNIDQETRHSVPNSRPAVPAGSLPPFRSSAFVGIPFNGNGGPLHSVIVMAFPTSGLHSPPSTSTFSFQAPSCQKEARTPRCAASPPPFLSPSPLPLSSTNTPVSTRQLPPSVAVPSTVTATASAGPTSQATSDPGVVDMDTTPPSQAVIFRSPTGSANLKPALDAEAMDTTPPSKAAIFQSPTSPPRTASHLP
ncbi:nuclear pore-associated protein 1-like [Diceros bicornis minor]|uniref:nuclear pore-associated protein 1-like n=1 Tax=Diceros bicornis minor TaxID=77932 RepID=UPI0026F13F34|nr:nuclear pore-associated protein 1-like [Diceros bicornis minor]